MGKGDDAKTRNWINHKKGKNRNRDREVVRVKVWQNSPYTVGLQLDVMGAGT